MIATNIEQSKHLLELGLSTDSADMFWMDTNGVKPCLKLMDDGIFNHRNYLVRFPNSSLPAWSLSALLEVMPKELVNVGYNKKGEQVVSLAKLIIDTFIVDERSMWRIGYKGKRRYWVKCYSDNPIRAAWDMISFLIRQGYIKKGGES